ncbi:dNTP triphosphohydrolase [Acetobacteraceae bacterium H6797]|nr:dNTP triphosphohydrolase [Acetobacteraceae bacterium H6797]
MGWASLFEPRRFTEAVAREHANRNPFQIDQDRIAFSRPFRRLQQKTQVHPLPFNAHVRNRLLHTLEVASVGRSLGFAAGSLITSVLEGVGRKPDDLGYLVQAVCLAHDIGNPPFGHAGEAVIAGWMQNWLASAGPKTGLDLHPDLGHFDGNAQGFRILTRADGYRERGGLRLTYASLGAFLKYPWPASDPRAVRGGKPGVKFGYFATEAEAFADVVGSTGLIGSLPRHPAVWLMEAADDISYTLVDLEDAVELSILPYETYEMLVKPLAQVDATRLAREESDPQRIALLRSLAIGRLVEAVAKRFVEELPAILAGSVEPRKGLISMLRAEQPELADGMAEIVKLSEKKLYLNTRKIEYEIGARDVLGKALEVFVPACAAYAQVQGDEARLDYSHRQALSLMQDYHPKPGYSPSDCLRCAIDFVSGVTDNYAGWLAARLRGL